MQSPGCLATLADASTEVSAALAVLPDDVRRDPARATTAVRRQLPHRPPDVVAAALTQVQLRTAARAKLPAADANRMLFTRPGLEQLTHHGPATHRARRLRAALGPAARLVDLGCGLGGDLVAAARAGLHVMGVELDAHVAALARANLDALGLLERARVVVGDAEAPPARRDVAVHADPARRTAAARTFDPAAYRPGWPVIVAWLQDTARPAVVTTSPALPMAIVPDEVQVEMVSWRGELKECVLWSGRLRQGEAARQATLLPAGWTLDAPATPPPARVSPPGAYLVEPDPALIRAGLVTTVAQAVAGWQLDEHLAYVSCDAEPPARWGRRYRVLEVRPYDERALRRSLRERGVGRLTVKRRGLQVDPEQVRRRLRSQGDAAATVVLSRTPRGAVALITEPVLSSD